MLSEKYCKDVLNRKKKKFTNEEILKIRELLYKMAKVVLETKSVS